MRNGPPPPPSTEDPKLLKIDPSCLHAALKEFFQPLRTNDTRADFFAVYRKESEEFDRDYARKYDEDLNTSLIFAGLFSAVSSAFIIDVQPKLEPDPNEINAAYMRVLLHAVDASLYPDADPLAAVSWNGPAPEIVTVQCLLYASLATSLFAAFMSMLGKQWVNRYIRNRGGSAAEKSWDRQQKLDGMQRWYFHIVMEGLPVMLQIALVLLGCALSQYLWTINRTVAGVIIAVTLFGFGFHFIVTIAAAVSYDCPFQTPPSIAIRALASYVSRHHPSLGPSLRSSVPRVLHTIRLPITWSLSLLRLLSASIIEGLACASTTQTHVTPEIPLAVVAEPTRIFDDSHIDWVTHGADARCVAWVLYSTTDHDVILSSVHFSADIIWYPTIAGALSPFVLAELFFGCFMDKQVLPGRVEQASAVAMALASVLSAQLCSKPENEDLKELCGRIVDGINELPGDNGAIFPLVMWTLGLVVRPSDPSLILPGVIIPAAPDLNESGISAREMRGAGFTTFRLWVARVLLQTMWRWRRRYDSDTIICFPNANFVMRVLFESMDHTSAILKSTVSLALAIGLGLRVDIYDTYIPDTLTGLSTICNLLNDRLMNAILNANKEGLGLRSTLSTLFHVGLQDLQGFHPFCFTWLGAVLYSDYPDTDKYELAGLILMFLHDKAARKWSGDRTKLEFPRYAVVLSRFLLLHEKREKEDLGPKDRSWEFNPLVLLRAHPITIALRLLLGTPKDILILPVFLVITPALQQSQWSITRTVALKLFNHHRNWLFSPRMEALLPAHRAKLLRAIGDPFDMPAAPYPGRTQVRDPGDTHLSAKVMGLLLALSSSETWRDHLHPTNFASCDAIMAGEEQLRDTITFFSNWSGALKGPGDSNFSGLVLGVGRLKQLRCHSAVKLILLSIWSTPITPLYDQEVWRWVERQTLELFSARGEEHFGIFVSQIKKTYGKAMMDLAVQLKRSEGENDLPNFGSPFRVDGVGRRVRTNHPRDPGPWDSKYNFYTMCQLRRLYRLLEHDPTSAPNSGVPREGTPPPPPIGPRLVPQSDQRWSASSAAAETLETRRASAGSRGLTAVVR